MTDDAIAKNILKFVKLLDGGDTDDRVMQAAIRRNWLDDLGEPTPDGRKMIHSFHRMNFPDDSRL